VCGRRDRSFWPGLAVLGSAGGRARMLGLVLAAVFTRIARNWLMLRAVGVHASVFDATAVLIAMVAPQLPVRPSVGAAAAVLMLGTDGPAAAAAAGVLLTATGTAGALGTWRGRASTAYGPCGDLPAHDRGGAGAARLRSGSRSRCSAPR
jgi:hypothetical protein